MPYSLVNLEPFTMLKYYRYCLLIIIIFASFLNVKAESVKAGEVLKLQYARNFEITDFLTHQIATVRISGNDSKRLYQYALVPRGVPLPELPKDIPVIRTPVERVVVLETIYIGFLEALNQLEKVTGAGATNYISNPTIRQRVKTGIIQTVQTGQALNVERLILLQPDLIFISFPNEPASNISAQLSRAGLPAVMTAEYKEQHPLARAEWIKFVAAFLDASEEADKTFAAVAKRYEALLQTVDSIEKRPTIFCGAPYAGTWHMAGGNSYMAKLIRDAGGDYLWNDVTSTDSIPLDFERVFLKAATADIWLNPGIHKSRQSLFSTDSRFKRFNASQAGDIYNNTRKQIKNTGNPVWENGVVRPDDVLADLIKIFHPDRLPDHEFVYQEQLK